MIEPAIQWVRARSFPGGGICVSSRQNVVYPEVTGYLIPSLLRSGERDLARQYATFLGTIQNPDGSFCGPNSRTPFVFDTGQVIRGWASILPEMPELQPALRRACDWLIRTADPESGRLLCPAAGGDWSLGGRGEVSEGVHLFALEPLRQAGRLLNCPDYDDFVRRSLRYYLENVSLTDFRQRHMLTHLFCYIQEALFDLGEVGRCREGMNSLGTFQGASGALPAYFDVPWVCSPGQIQAAIVWFKLGEYERAEQTLRFAEQLQNRSGGWFGSYGMDAEYFPSEELSWAVKFYLDADALRIQGFFDAKHAIFPEQVSPQDGRLRAIIDSCGSLNGRRVLDVGCGKGRFSAALQRAFPHAEIHAIDLSPELLRHVPSSISCRQGSMLQLPWPAESFDVVFCVEALEHAQREEVAVAEMCRVLRPGGDLLIIDKNRDHWGAMETPNWEKWFRPGELKQTIERHCDDAEWRLIAYDQQQQADGLFVAWHGRRRGATLINGREKQLSVKTGQATTLGAAAGPKPLRPLEAEEWHDAIVANATPAQTAARVRSDPGPEWFSAILDATRAGETVLELGSGTGELSARLALAGRKVILLDYSHESLEFSQQLFAALGLTAEWQHGDIRQRLSLPDKAVDVVWSSGVLEHFSDSEIIHILKESARVARRSVFSLVPNARSLAYRLGKHQQEASGRWAYGYEDPKFSISHLFRAAGLREVEEFTVAAQHALAFLDAPELAPARSLWQGFLASLSKEDLRRMQQGYLLASLGHVRPKRRLAVVPSDPLEEYEKAGYGSWLAEYYNPAGFFDEVYCLSPMEKEARFAHGMNVVPTPESAFADRVRSLGIDVVRAYGGYWAADLACGNQVPGVPVVVSLHDARPAWVHDSVREAARVLAVSGSVRDLAVRRGIPPERLVAIPNRVDFHVFAPVTDSEVRTAWAERFPGKYRILHVGRRDPVKNLDSLLRALALLDDNYSLIAVGRGNADPYRTLAAELAVQDRCWFIDSVPSNELPVFYSGCSCMCTPSRNEGFGIVFVEALACGAVVVASDIAPMNEYIRHEENGVLVRDYENPRALADTVIRACTDKLLRQHLQSQARASVRSFERDHVARQEAGMYEEVLANRSRSN